MRFEEVLEGMRLGKKYRLPSWEDGRFITLSETFDRIVGPTYGDTTSLSTKEIMSEQWEQFFAKKWVDRHEERYIGFVVLDESEEIVPQLFMEPNIHVEKLYAPRKIRWERIAIKTRILVQE